MNGYHEKRKYHRIANVWKVIINNDQNIKSYIRDFSKKGIKLWINVINGLTNQKMSIQIPHPQKPYSIFMELDIYPVWIKQYERLQFTEVGCKIEQPNIHQEILLNELIDLFQSSRHLEDKPVK